MDADMMEAWLARRNTTDGNRRLTSNAILPPFEVSVEVSEFLKDNCIASRSFPEPEETTAITVEFRGLDIIR